MRITGTALDLQGYETDRTVMPTNHDDVLKRILAAQLGRSYPPDFFTDRTPLLGSIPELDSMAVVGILTAIEEELGIPLSDDEISADAFATFADLSSFVSRMRGA